MKGVKVEGFKAIILYIATSDFKKKIFFKKLVSAAKLLLTMRPKITLYIRVLYVPYLTKTEYLGPFRHKGPGMTCGVNCSREIVVR